VGGGKREAGSGRAEAGHAMTDGGYDEYAALLDAVRGIRWPARSVVRGGIPGAHTSRLRGISAEFTEYRPYRQGDETRRVDWKLFARSDRAYIRLSNDRAILPTMIVLDASASMAFPVPTNAKWQAAAQIAVALGAVARSSGDPVGVVIAQGDDSLMIPPRMRRTVIHEIIRAVSSITPSGSDPLAPSVSIAAQWGGRVVIVTDLLGDAAALLVVAGRLVAAGRDVHVVHVIAGQEVDPPRGATLVSDPESPQLRRALTGATRAAYLDAFREWRENVAHELAEVGVAYFAVVVGDEATDHLIRRITAPRGVGATI
jgi:uncharacterized protein (DUF58 family)